MNATKTKTAETKPTEITLPDHVHAAILPVLAARRAWLRCYSEDRPQREGMLEAAFLAAWTPYHRKLRAIELDQAAAYAACRYVVREAVTSMPCVLRGDVKQVTWVTDGVRINYRPWKDDCIMPQLCGTKYR